MKLSTLLFHDSNSMIHGVKLLKYLYVEDQGLFI